MAALERARDYHSKALEFTRAIPFPYAACPACGHDMVATSVTPTFLRDGCEDINYICKRCDAQMQRRVKSSRA
jgi:transcription elongation factor Elf1